MSSFVVKLRGLPWSCTVDDIKGFLEPVEPENGDEGVHLLLSNEGNFRGKFNGEALVELKSDEDLEEAVKKNKEHMGKRYVEVFEAKKGELDYRCGPDFHPDECIVKLRGLPYGSTKDDIEDFFKDLEIMPNGIMLSTDPRGKTTGEAFVQFKTVKMTEKALEKHKEHMGKRYIEVFKSNLEFMRRSCSNEDKPPSLFDCDIDNGFKGGNNRGNNFNNGPFNNNGPMGNNMNFMNNGGPMGNMGGPMNNNRFGGPMNNNNRFGGGPMNNGGFNGPMNNGGMNNGGGNNRMAPYDRNNRPNRFNNRDSDGPNVRGGKIVHMRGLPFRATEDDVIEFFQPLKAVNIEMGVGEDGRSSGKADVEFRNPADAADAMTRNKNNMQHRYIELFIDPAEGDGDFVCEEETTWDMDIANQGPRMNQNMGNQNNMGYQNMANRNMGNQNMGNNSSGPNMEMMSNMMNMMKSMIGGMGSKMNPEMMEAFQKMSGNMGGDRSQSQLSGGDDMGGDKYGDRQGGGKMRGDRKSKFGPDFKNEGGDYSAGTKMNQYGNASGSYGSYGVKSESKYSDKSAVADTNKFGNNFDSQYNSSSVGTSGGFGASNQASTGYNQGTANTSGYNQDSSAAGYSNTSGYNQTGNVSGYNQNDNSSSGYNQGGNSSGYSQGGNTSGYNQGSSNSGYNQTGSASGYNQSGTGSGYNQGGNSSGYSQSGNSYGGYSQGTGATTGYSNTAVKSEYGTSGSGYNAGASAGGYGGSSSAATASTGYSGNWSTGGSGSTGGNVRSSWN